MKLLRLYILILLTSGLLAPAAVKGQVLRDTVAIKLVKSCVDNIYNFRFEKARELCTKIDASFPGHPVVLLLNGMTEYWENFPLLPFTPESGRFENYLLRCISLCETRKEPSDYAEILLSNLGARGLLLEYYADNNMSKEVFALARSTYRYLRESFDYVDSYDDFYFFTGLYNYYREAYPEAHPVYKVLAVLFPGGDIETGLAEMKRAASMAVMLKAESAFFLTHVYVNFENNYEEAGIYSRALYNMYPGNEQYQVLLIKSHLLSRDYDGAETLIRSAGSKTTNPFVKAELTIFKGIVSEKKYKDPVEAQKLYNQGIADISPYISYGDEVAAYAFFGLSRIAGINNDRQNRKLYRKRALELTDYKDVNFDE